MKTRSMIIVLCIISFVLSACAPTTPQATVTPTPLPTSTITATPTVTPTSTATPDPFAGLNECFTWRDARENCVVSLEDLMSGKLVDYARKVTKPFPDGALFLQIQPIGFTQFESYYFNSFAPEGVVLDASTKAWLRDGGKWNQNNAIFSDPRSPIGEELFFWVKGDGTSNLDFDVPAVVTKIKNKDGTDGYYAVINLPPVSMGDDNGPFLFPNLSDESFDDYFNHMAYYPPSRSQGRFQDSGYRAILEKYGKVILGIVDDDTRKSLLDKWMYDGVIPKELEKLPLMAGGFPGSGTPWAK